MEYLPGDKTSFAIRLVIMIFTVVALLVPGKSYAQISIMAGGNYCDVRNNNLIKNQKSAFTYYMGVSFKSYPVKSFHQFSLLTEAILTCKGYKQDLDSMYHIYFNYLAFPVIVSLAPLDFFSVNAGVELSCLFSTSTRQGTSTYNRFDVGLVLGMTLFDNRTVNLYSRVTYGLLPMLDYYTFDRLGNFTGEIHDLRNTCISVGIKIKISNEANHVSE